MCLLQFYSLSEQLTAVFFFGGGVSRQLLMNGEEIKWEERKAAERGGEGRAGRHKEGRRGEGDKK